MHLWICSPIRTKDCKFVYCCLKKAVTEVLEKAEQLGNTIKLIVLKVWSDFVFIQKPTIL